MEINSENQQEAQDIVENAMAEVQASIDEMSEQVTATGDDTKPVGQPSTESPVPVVSDADSDQNDPSDKIQLLGDVDLHVMIELGRTEMLVEDVLRIGEGSVVELDKLAGDPVDVYVNQHLIARGEVLVLNDNFCIRVSEIVDSLEEQADAVIQQQQADAADE